MTMLRQLRSRLPPLALLTLVAAAPASAADLVTVRAAQHEAEGFGRIAFDWPAPVAYAAEIVGGRLRVHFARPLSGAVDVIGKRLGAYLDDVHLGDDGSTIEARLRRPATLRSFTSGHTIAVDLVTAESDAAPTPALTPPPAKRVAAAKPAPVPAAVPASAPAASAEPPIAIRSEFHDGVRRVEFDWHHPIDYRLSETGGVAELRFESTAPIDAARLDQALPGLAALARETNGKTFVTLTVPSGTDLRHFRRGNRIVLELASPDAVLPPIATKTARPRPEAIEPAAGPPAVTVKIAPAVPQPQPQATAISAPPADPPLFVHYTASAQGASLRFDWSKPTASAVFRRGGALWVVFAGAHPLDLTEASAALGPVVKSITQLPDGKATVLRLTTRPGINPSVRRADTAWIVDLKPQDGQPDAPVAIEARPTAATPDAFLAVRGAAAPVYLRDPDVGDMLAIVPIEELGQGIAAEQQFVDFRSLVSVQGIALRLSGDDVALNRADGGIEITRPGGLMLSSDADRQLARRPVEAANRLLDFAAWTGPADQSFLQKRSRLEQAAAAVAPTVRTKPRLALARFYFANLDWAEAQGVLEAVEEDDPDAAATPSVQLMKGAISLMEGDAKAAAPVLGQKLLDGEREATLWRGALAAANDDWANAGAAFVPTVDDLARYPKILRNRLALEAARAFLETKQGDAAAPILDLVLKDDPETADKAMALYLQGERAAQQGAPDRALALWHDVALMGDRPSRARALYATTLAKLDAGTIGRTDAIKAFDGLRFAWRGDDFEFALMHKLGELKLADGDLRGAFEAMREASANFPDNAGSADMMKQLSDAVAALFLGKALDDMPPLKAVALYDEFKDFAPVGEPGDVVVRRLVDRLVAVDLLDSAAALLEDQVAHRLTGRDKARVAAQLALLRLFDHKPDAALAALDIEVDKDLPVDLLRQRQQLRARALAELKRDDEALAILEGDTSRDADRLRADIFWRSRNWAEAAKVFARLVPAPGTQGGLDKESAQLVLNWASALTLAGDQAGLAVLRGNYGGAMAATKLATAFRIVAGDMSASGDRDSDPVSVAKRVAQLPELQSFMASLKERVAKEKLSDIN